MEIIQYYLLKYSLLISYHLSVKCLDSSFRRFHLPGIDNLLGSSEEFSWSLVLLRKMVIPNVADIE